MSDQSTIGPKPLEANDPHVQAYLDELKRAVIQPFVDHILQNGFETKKMMTLMRDLMESVETTALDGLRRKEVVVGLMRETVGMLDERVLPDESRRMVLQMIDGEVFEQTIDLVVAATKGELSVNTVAEHLSPGCMTQVGRFLSTLLRKIFRKKKVSGKKPAPKPRAVAV
jgi:hypothetical protein